MSIEDVLKLIESRALSHRSHALDHGDTETFVYQRLSARADECNAIAEEIRECLRTRAATINTIWGQQ